MTSLRRTAGFTLIELSVSMLVIGLLAAGIVIGNDMIKGAQVRGIISEVDEFGNAIVTFQSKYNALPGDMADAYDVLGSVGGCTNANTVVTWQGCNGNGNRKYELYDGSSAAQIAATTVEGLRAWQHLSQAGLISGSYTGPYNATADANPGVNVPMSKKIKPAGFQIYNTLLSDWTWTNTNSRRISSIRFAKYYNLPADPPPRIASPTLNPEDMSSIDKKMDDGKPGQGKIVVYPAGGCTSGTDALTATYVSGPSQSCTPEFELQY